MPGLASINIRFAVNLSELRTQLQNATSLLQKQGDQMQSAGRSLSAYVTAPLVAMGAASLKTFGDIEALDKGLIAVMGSAEAAGIEFENLREVAKLPGLGLEEAVRGSVNLQAAGFSADEARASLLAFGNALATVGKGKRELDLVTLALTQLNNKSSGFGQDLRQLTEQLPQLRGALTNAFGTSDSEAIAKLGVSGKQVVQLLTKEFAKLPKAVGGFNNALENTSDNLKIRFAQLGESIYKSFNIEDVLARFDKALGEIVDSFKELEPTTQKAILTVTGLTAAAGPFLFALGGILKALPLVASGFAAVSASALPVIAAAGALFLAYQAVTAKSKEMTAEQYRQADEQKLMNELTAQATKEVAAHRLQLDQLVLTARNANAPLADRKKAIQEINKISPEYLGNITLETIKTDAATQAINRYNESLFKGALARAALSKIDQNAQRRIEAQLQYERETYQFNLKKNEAIAKGGDAVQKFFKEEGGAQERAYLRYQDRLGQLDQENVKLREIYGSNKSYLELLKNVGASESSNANILQGAKNGTIDYYAARIQAQQKLRDSLATTSDAYQKFTDKIAELEKKRDALMGKRAPVVSVTEQVGGLKAPEFAKSDSRKSVDFFQQQIDAAKAAQAAYTEADAEWQNFRKQIEGYELSIKLIVDPSSVIKASREVVPAVDAMSQKQQELQTIAMGVSQGVAGAFESMSTRFVDSLGMANDGMQGFLRGLSAVVIKIISAMLAQSISQAIAGAVASGTATGPAAIVTTPAFIAEAIAGVLGAFASIPKFADGGIVGGSSYFGDRLLARVNSGEMFLNRDQQRRVYDMINPALNHNDMRAIRVIGTTEISGSDLHIVFNRWDGKKNRFE